MLRAIIPGSVECVVGASLMVMSWPRARGPFVNAVRRTGMTPASVAPHANGVRETTLRPTAWHREKTFGDILRQPISQEGHEPVSPTVEEGNLDTDFPPLDRGHSPTESKKLNPSLPGGSQEFSALLLRPTSDVTGNIDQGFCPTHHAECLDVGSARQPEDASAAMDVALEHDFAALNEGTLPTTALRPPISSSGEGTSSVTGVTSEDDPLLPRPTPEDRGKHARQTTSSDRSTGLPRVNKKVKMFHRTARII